MSKHTRTRGEDYQAPAPVPKTQRTRGRPSEYDEAVLPEVAEMLRNGATSREIINHLGVSSGTFWRWCAAYPQLRNAVKAGKEAQDERVVDALRINAVLDGNVTAQIFWLKNRQPELWRDRKETEIIVPDPGTDTEQLDTRSAALAALALFTEAQYDPRATGALLEATANAEESDYGEDRDSRGPQRWEDRRDALPDGQGHNPDADPDDWESGVDLDPGEL